MKLMNNNKTHTNRVFVRKNNYHRFKRHTLHVKHYFFVSFFFFLEDLQGRTCTKRLLNIIKWLAKFKNFNRNSISSLLRREIKQDHSQLLQMTI